MAYSIEDKMKIFDIETTNNFEFSDVILSAEVRRMAKDKYDKDSGWVNDSGLSYVVSIRSTSEIPFDDLEKVMGIRAFENSKNLYLTNLAAKTKIHWDKGHFDYTFFFLNWEEC